MIDLIKVSASYDKKQVLSDITCTFKPGDFVCIIGRNGCGKSTLLRVISGLLPYNGSLLLNGNELCTLSKSDRAKQLSYLPQIRPVPHMNVCTLISHGRYPHLGFSKTLTQRDKEHIEKAAEVAGVENLLYRNLATLSGGERQRAYIAMTVAQDADIMLLDEPTAHLDIEHQLEVMKLLIELHKGGKGIIMVAHDLQQAFSFASHIILLADCTVREYGAPNEIYLNELLQDTFGIVLKRAVHSDSLYSYWMAKGRDN